MKILIEAEIEEQHDEMVAARLDNGFGQPIVPVKRDRIVGFGSQNHLEYKTRTELILALEAAEHSLTVRQGCVMDFEKAEAAAPTEAKINDSETLAQIDLALKACGRRPS